MYPQQVSMQFRSRHICGGSILNGKTVLTAAHCCKAITESGFVGHNVKVVAGLINLEEESKNNGNSVENIYM